MELRHLRYFVAVGEELSFSRAARRLHTAQPSLSQQIRDLEREVGCTLLERDHHHVSLTPAGHAFLSEARLTLGQAERAVELARLAVRSIRIRSGLDCFPDTKHSFFPDCCPRSVSAFPKYPCPFGACQVTNCWARSAVLRSMLLLRVHRSMKRSSHLRLSAMSHYSQFCLQSTVWLGRREYRLDN